MCTVFWGAPGVALLNFLKPRATAIFECHNKTLMKLEARIADTNLEKKTFFLQHDNARPHMNCKTTECVTKFGWTVLPYLPNSHDLAPSDFCLYRSL